MSKDFFLRVPWGRISAKNWHLGHTEKGCKKVLLLHGNSDHAQCWDWTADRLPKNWSVVGFDFPGHGKSNMPENLYSTSLGVQFRRGLFGKYNRKLVKKNSPKLLISAYSKWTKISIDEIFSL